MDKKIFFDIMIVLLAISSMRYASAPPPQPSDFLSESSLYNNQPIQIGHVVSAYTLAGVLCGTFTVTAESEYGPLHCQGDDPAIAGDDGAYESDTISFYIEDDDAVVVGDSTWNSGQSQTADLTSVNSAPTISSISGLSGTVKGGSSQTVTANINDVDHPKGTADQTRIFVCTTDSATSSGCGGNTYCSTSLSSTISPNCNFNVESDDISHDYYVFVVDAHDAISSSTSGSYTSDSTPPTIDSFSPSSNSWTNDDTPYVILTSNENSQCKYDATPATEYTSKTYTMDDSTTSHSITLQSLGSEGSHYRYFQCEDTVGNTMDIANEYNYTIKLDETNPLAGAVSISNSNWNITHMKNTTIDFNWSGYSDGPSGLNYYYYSFSDGPNGGAQVSSSTLSATLTGASQGSNTVYVWAEDKATNEGASASVSIIVDTVSPTVSYAKNDLKSYSTDDFNITVTISDATTSIKGTPEYRYKIGSDAWGSWTDLISSGADWKFGVSKPGTDWDSRKGETISYEVRVNDTLDNQKTQAGTEVIDDFFLITFNVTDRILNQSLTGLNIVANDDTCNGGGCNFDYNVSVQKLGSTTLSYTITKSGFQTVSNSFTVTESTVVNISMNDTQNPTIDALNFVARTGSGNEDYYIDLTVNSSDNLAVESVSFIYGIGGPTKDLNLSLTQSGSTDSWTGTLGPFTDSMKIYSTSNATDYYDNKGGNDNPILWFLFIAGTGSDQVTTTVSGGGSSGSSGSGIITSPGLIGTYFDAIVKIFESSLTIGQGGFAEAELTLINKGKEPDRDTWLTYYLIGPDGKKYFETREQIYEIPIGEIKLSKKLKVPKNAEQGTWQFHMEYQTSMQPLIHVWDSFEVIKKSKKPFYFPLGSLKEFNYFWIIIPMSLLILLFKRRKKEKKEKKIIKRKSHIEYKNKIKRNLKRIKSRTFLIAILSFMFMGILFLAGNNMTGFVVSDSVIEKNNWNVFGFVLIIGILGLLTFLFRNKIKVSAEKVKDRIKPKHSKNSVKGLMKKKVYTWAGEYMGKVEEVILEENKIDVLKIKLCKIVKKKVKKEGIVIKYNTVKWIGPLVVIDDTVLGYLNKF